MTYEKTMQIIRRGTYRMKVIQNGGKFIPVIDGNALTLHDQLIRKNEYDKIMYDRENKYSGFDDVSEVEETDVA